MLVAAPSRTSAAGLFQQVPAANCGPGSSPEDGVQGQVPLTDRLDGRSQMGYWCNLQLVGHVQGEGASWQNAWYDHCDYMDTADDTGVDGTGVGGQQHLGVDVIDVSDLANPKITEYLQSPGMLHPWEDLKVNAKRGLLAGAPNGGAPFDVYDVSKDCAHPTLLSSVPMPNNGHEGEWEPDGRTYWGSSTSEYHAIDVSDPSHPKELLSWAGPTGHTHGLSFSDDGTRAYFTILGEGPAGGSTAWNGLVIADISDIQYRRPNPQVRIISETQWTDGSDAQHTIPITIGGKPYLVFVDESGPNWIASEAGWEAACAQGLPPYGQARIFDISDEKHPKLVSRVTLQTDNPSNCAAVVPDTAGQVIFGYDSHYCAVDREHDATALACGYFNSGIRVFDIRDPANPKEIAYYNPPAQLQKQGQLPGSEHDAVASGTGASALTADWCSSRVRFYEASDGTWYLWGQCQDFGFMTLKFTNGVYPLAPETASGAGTAVYHVLGASSQSASETTAYGLPSSSVSGGAASSSGSVPSSSEHAGAPAPSKRAPGEARPIAAAAAYQTPLWLPLAAVLLWFLLLLNLGLGRRGRAR